VHLSPRSGQPGRGERRRSGKLRLRTDSSGSVHRRASVRRGTPNRVRDDRPCRDPTGTSILVVEGSNPMNEASAAASVARSMQPGRGALSGASRRPAGGSDGFGHRRSILALGPSQDGTGGSLREAAGNGRVRGCGDGAAPSSARRVGREVRGRGCPRASGRTLEGKKAHGRIGRRSAGNGGEDVTDPMTEQGLEAGARTGGFTEHRLWQRRRWDGDPKVKGNGKGATATVTWCGCGRGESFGGCDASRGSRRHS
jgi:hypothetical protein